MYLPDGKRAQFGTMNTIPKLSQALKGFQLNLTSGTSSPINQGGVSAQQPTSPPTSSTTTPPPAMNSQLPNQPQPPSPQQPPKPPTNVVSHPTANRAAKGSQTPWHDAETIDKIHDGAATWGKKIVDFVWIPVTFFGGILSRSAQVFTGDRAYLIAGGLVSFTGLMLSYEAMVTSVSGIEPFFYKPGLDDNAQFSNFVTLAQSNPSAVIVPFFICFMVQVVESVVFRDLARSAKNKGRKHSKKWWLWVLVGLSYALEFNSTWQQYARLGLSFGVVIFWFFATFGAEMGAALSEAGEQQ